MIFSKNSVNYVLIKSYLKVATYSCYALNSFKQKFFYKHTNPTPPLDALRRAWLKKKQQILCVAFCA